jgi:outer membrane protein insertion porin family
VLLCALFMGATGAGCAAPCGSPWGQCTTPGALPQAPIIVPPASQPGFRAAPAIPSATSQPGMTIRGQSPGAASTYDAYGRGPTPVSGGPVNTYQPPAPYNPIPFSNPPAGQPTVTYQPPAGGIPGPPLPAPPAEAMPPLGGVGPGAAPTMTPFLPYTNVAPTPEELSATPTPLDIFVEETRTGRFMFGVAVNSDAGVTGQITIDERNFDATRFPTSWDDIMNGTAWRGAGQGFRIEAQPGSQVQRYLISFTEPYFLNTNVSFNASAFYFDRNYFDWDESRYGGRVSWGYRLTPDLSVSAALGAQNVNVFNPRVDGVEELDRSVGNHDLYTARVTVTHDTRDLPFMPTEGHLIELSGEQAFGDFDYPRGEVEFAQYFLVRERPDGSGRHTVAFTTKAGFSGADTPIFENYFAGGYSTLRGFAFRGASPVVDSVRVGGEFRWINSLEYIFPLTADDMIKGIVFCDFGTVEQKIALKEENFRVAPGFGFRINVPALGPAPLAFDFAFPVASAVGDNEQQFSFFFGALR